MRPSGLQVGESAGTFRLYAGKTRNGWVDECDSKSQLTPSRSTGV